MGPWQHQLGNLAMVRHNVYECFGLTGPLLLCLQVKGKPRNLQQEIEDEIAKTLAESGVS